MSNNQTDFDVIVVGGGPSGATAAHEIALAGHRVLLLERAFRIKPCGGAANGATDGRGARGISVGSGGQPPRPLVSRTNGETDGLPRDIFAEKTGQGSWQRLTGCRHCVR